MHSQLNFALRRDEPTASRALDFTLYYRGDLKSNGSPADKHAIRRHVHAQLKDLWQHFPLSNFKRLLASPEEYGEGSLIRRVHGFNFAPLVTEFAGHVAELHIQLLWPAAPGSSQTAETSTIVSRPFSMR